MPGYCAAGASVAATNAFAAHRLPSPAAPLPAPKAATSSATATSAGPVQVGADAPSPRGVAAGGSFQSPRGRKKPSAAQPLRTPSALARLPLPASSAAASFAASAPSAASASSASSASSISVGASSISPSTRSASPSAASASPAAHSPGASQPTENSRNASPKTAGAAPPAQVAQVGSAAASPAATPSVAPPAAGIAAAAVPLPLPASGEIAARAAAASSAQPASPAGGAGAGGAGGVGGAGGAGDARAVIPPSPSAALLGASDWGVGGGGERNVGSLGRHGEDGDPKGHLSTRNTSSFSHLSRPSSLPSSPTTALPCSHQGEREWLTEGEREWLTEVSVLAHLSHPNLISLVGYCAHHHHRMLVYPYLPNGSLERKLFGLPAKETLLTWQQRIGIAVGAAKGLAYLHEEMDRPIIYRDFKTSNILLTKDWQAKLSDFGLARSGPEGDNTHVSTRVVGYAAPEYVLTGHLTLKSDVSAFATSHNPPSCPILLVTPPAPCPPMPGGGHGGLCGPGVVGTVGYAAPEYVLTGHLTVKSDVYSFGVVLLELMTGRLALDKSRPKEEQSLAEWAAPFLASPSKLYRIMDPALSGRYSVKGAQTAAAVARDCLTRKAKQRPRMSEVVTTLQPVLELFDMAGFDSSGAGVAGGLGGGAGGGVGGVGGIGGGSGAGGALLTRSSSENNTSTTKGGSASGVGAGGGLGSGRRWQKVGAGQGSLAQKQLSLREERRQLSIREETQQDRTVEDG
ncbi:unnamed protein product [Closterium sp. NIES-65]|nr:unnamed protein product [Closterium sp. NIES-65]